MLDIYRKELQSLRALEGTLPPILKTIVEAVPNQGIPYRMKLAFAVSELVMFTSHFRRSIAHWNGSLIPINAITFSISGSGTGKDSSVNAVRKCFQSGYDLLEKKRKDVATANAIKAAAIAGEPTPEEWSNYKDYYKAPGELFIAPSTVEGFIQHLNDLEEAGVGGGYMYDGEFGASLANSPVLVENIKLLAELYDEGKKEVKVLKNKDNQSKAIRGLPTSALFVGSQDNLLFDDSIKRKFRTEFSTKLARRSFFNYSPERIPPLSGATAKAVIEQKKALEDSALLARTTALSVIRDITVKQLPSVGKPITVDPDTRDLFILYELYNAEIAETIKAQYPIAKISRTHMQWKALKLAGAIAIFSGHTSIMISDYISAISYVEMLSKDLEAFEAELVKEPYEVFVDFVHHEATDGKYSIGLHTLRKLGYIPMTGVPTARMKELVHLAASYDPLGIYTVCDAGICYEQQVKTDITGVSYLEVSGTKEQRQKMCASGYEFYETDFSELAEMLKGDFAYTPFRFKDGIRGKDYIIGGCSWIVLDVDESSITDEEAHFMLSDINHHIARTSDATNPFKFRILIELDSIVDISGIQWKHFIKSISDELAITVDLLPQSQIYFSYAGRDVLSTLDAKPLEAKQHIIRSADMVVDKEAAKPITPTQAKTLLADPLTTFSYAYECANGSGSRSLIRAAYHAKDLGMSEQEVIALMRSISDYWDYPLDPTRLENTLISQVRRIFN